ncbi:MAG: GNAT family N-acetyltransferase, partial [Armatimonadota bacterium]|nr:GNAT family N-acetyltransferase [Armatimonadota bacterium]
IRPLLPRDLEAADRIVQAAFEIDESRLASLQQLLRLQADGWFLAVLDGAPVGVTGGLDYGTFVYGGLFAVHPAAQGRGVGMALLQHWLGWVAARGMPHVAVDASDAGAALCRRVGFVEVDLTDVWEHAGGTPWGGAALPAAPPQPPRAQARGAPEARVRSLRAGDLDALAAADARVFGGDRRAVLQELLDAHPGRALAVDGPRGALAGYLIAQARRLGPWAAASPADAGALLVAASALGFESGPVTLTPRANAAAAVLLERAGFRRVRSTHYMVLGTRRPPGQRTRIYGAASAALG